MANALTTRQADIQMMLAAEVHLGTKNCDLQMEGYVFKRRPDVVEEAKAKEQEEEEAKEKEQKEEEEVAVLKDYLADWCDRWSFTIPDVPWSAGGWTRADAPAGADGWVSASAPVLTGDAAAFVWE